MMFGRTAEYVPLLGGFESSSMKFWDGRRFDAIGQTNHEHRAAEDYHLLANFGIRIVRDAMRWHLIEQAPGIYDWSSMMPVLHASVEAGVEVIWDLCHFGVPDHIDVLSSDFPKRFADYAAAAAEMVAKIVPTAPWWCPINEISYWAYAAGTVGFIEPVARGRPSDIKRQLVAAYLAGAERLKWTDSRARLLATDPLIHVTSRAGENSESRAAVDGSFAAWDMLLGRSSPELGGHEGAFDLIGANYFPDNQRSIEDGLIGMGCIGYQPLSTLLERLWNRYQLPILLSETGAEGANACSWLAHVQLETQLALRWGVPVEGVCLYPVMDYPGWIDGRHCRCGLIAAATNYLARTVDFDVAASIRTWTFCSGGSPGRVFSTMPRLVNA
jgi:hypothetical protein